MLDEAQIDKLLAQTLSSQVEKALEIAARYDHLDEHDAVMAFAVGAIQTGSPALLLAVNAGALAVRWHRTRKLEATVNSPEPGPSPE